MKYEYNTSRLIEALYAKEDHTSVGAASHIQELLLHVTQLQSRLEELNQKIDELEKENASLKQDATRYQDFKANNHIRFSLFSGRCRADNGHSILTDWLESFDECFDAAMQASKQ